MKISEMSTMQLAKALCTIAPAVGNITSDEAFVTAVKKLADGRKADMVIGQLLGGAISDFVPLLFDSHLEDIIVILSALTEKKPDEIRAQKGVQTIEDLKTCMDSDIVRFFASSVNMA